MFKPEVDPNKEFEKALRKSFKILGNLTVPYKEMTREWFKGNRSIFDEGRKGPGKYADLTASYKRQKTKAIGSPYPILRGFVRLKGGKGKKSGKLAKSMIEPKNKDAVSTVVNNKILVLGTKVTSKKGAAYPTMLNFGTKKMAARPFMLIGGEQTATSEVNQRQKNWIMLLEDFVIQSSKGWAT